MDGRAACVAASMPLAAVAPPTSAIASGRQESKLRSCTDEASRKVMTAS
jgi:hypothetical protein